VCQYFHYPPSYKGCSGTPFGCFHMTRARTHIIDADKGIWQHTRHTFLGSGAPRPVSAGILSPLEERSHERRSRPRIGVLWYSDQN
jgi:hypothetical protein